MTARYPGYDVLAKRHSLSWNEPTRRVIDQRIAISREPRFFTAAEFRTLYSVCERILPQPKDRPPVPLAACIDAMLLTEGDRGFRVSPLPYAGEAWRCGLAAIDAEARQAYGAAFCDLAAAPQDELLTHLQEGGLTCDAWGGMPGKLFFEKRVLVDIPAAYYAHPTAWNEIGFGGPASPRGYVRLELGRRDPWEAAEAKPGEDAGAGARQRDGG